MEFENKLPKGYETRTVDLNADKKLKVRIYAAAAAAAVLLTVLGCLIKSVSLLFDAAGALALIMRFILLVLVIAASLVGQEYLKCFILGRLTGKPARVVRGGMSAWIEYKCWLDRKSYVIMSLAPAAAVCLVTLLLMLMLPDKLFWQCYVIFTITLAGAAGDAYIAYTLFGEKGEVRVKNEGYNILIATEKKN